MALETYLVQVAFTADAMAGLVKNPENRLSSMIPIVEKMGGRFVGSWISFGEYDSIAVIEMPDQVHIKAFSMAAMAGGGLRHFHITPMMSFEKGVEAMKLAGDLAYQAPQED